MVHMKKNLKKKKEYYHPILQMRTSNPRVMDIGSSAADK